MGDDDDFVDFVSARWSSLYRLAWLLTGSEHAAQDVLQASLEKAYIHWPRVSTMASPEAWLRKVMVNRVVSDHRRPWARREWSRDSLPERPDDSFEARVADHEVLWPLVCALPDRQRAVIVLRYYEDLTDRQTAELLGCAVGTVKSQTHDAVAALRRGVVATREHGTVVEL